MSYKAKHIGLVVRVKESRHLYSKMSLGKLGFWMEDVFDTHDYI